MRPQPWDEATRRPWDHTIIYPRVQTGRENPRASKRSVSLPDTNRAHEVVCPTPASPHTSAPPATGWPRTAKRSVSLSETNRAHAAAKRSARLSEVRLVSTPPASQRGSRTRSAPRRGPSLYSPPSGPQRGLSHCPTQTEARRGLSYLCSIHLRPVSQRDTVYQPRASLCGPQRGLSHCPTQTAPTKMSVRRQPPRTRPRRRRRAGPGMVNAAAIRPANPQSAAATELDSGVNAARGARWDIKWC